MADSRPSTFQFTCPECFVGLKAPLEKVGARLPCPSCQANISVPEPPAAAESSDIAEVHEVYEVQPDDTAPDGREYLAVLCHLCHTRMYATEDEIGRKLTCPDCGTDTIVARSVEFEVQEEETEPVEFDGATEYEVHQGDWLPEDEARASKQGQIPLVCPLCHTRMHADEDQVGSTIVCPDCNTETLVPAAPDREPEPELEDVGEYGVGKPSEVFYPKFARMLDEPDTLPAEEARPQPPTSTGSKPRKVGPRRPPTAPKPPPAAAGRPNEGTAPERIVPRRAKPPTFSRMFTFLADTTVWRRCLGLTIAAAVVTVFPLSAAKLPADTAEGTMWEIIIAAQVISVVGTMILGALIVLPSCLAILQATASGTDTIEEWPEFMSFLCLENGLALSSLISSATIGYLLGQLPRIVGIPGWLGTSLGIYLGALFLFPILLLSLLERGSLLNFFSPKIAASLISHFGEWLLFYVQSVLLLAVLLPVAIPASQVLGVSAAPIIAAWFVAVMMVYFRLMGRLAWHLSGRRLQEEPIPAPDLRKLLKPGKPDDAG